jgi:MFS family permease
VYFFDYFLKDKPMFATLRQRNFALLWTAGLISITGDWVLFIGLPIYVYQLTQSTLATSVMFIAGMLPRLLLGSIAGVFVDRWDRRRTMVIANLMLGLGLLPLLLVRSVEQVWIVYLVQFFEASVSRFFAPAEGALLPTLVSKEYLVPANALNSLNNNLARLIGPAVGGLIAGVFSLAGVAVVDMISFWVAALLIAAIRIPSAQIVPVNEPTPRLSQLFGRVWQEWKEGLQVIWREPRLFRLFLIVTIPMIGEGIFSTLIVVFVSQVLNGGETTLGYLMSAQAVGGIIGSLFVGQITKGMPLYRLMGISAILFGLIDLALFNYPAFIPGLALGLLLMAIVGVPGIGYVTGLSTMLQTSAPDAYLGRVLGAFYTTAALLGLLGTMLAGYLGERLPVVSILNVQGLGYVIAGVLALLFLRRVYSVSAEETVVPIEQAEPA